MGRMVWLCEFEILVVFRVLFFSGVGCFFWYLFYLVSGWLCVLCCEAVFFGGFFIVLLGFCLGAFGCGFVCWGALVFCFFLGSFRHDVLMLFICICGKSMV